jgi:hypothetical protein
LCGEIRGVSNVRKSSSGRDFEKELKRERMSGRETSSVVAIAPVDILKAVDDGAWIGDADPSTPQKFVRSIQVAAVKFQQGFGGSDGHDLTYILLTTQSPKCS